MAKSSFDAASLCNNNNSDESWKHTRHRPAARTQPPEPHAILLYCFTSQNFLKIPRRRGVAAAGLPGSYGERGRVEREPESKQPSISECGVRAGRGDPWRPGRRCRVQAISVKCNQDVDMRPSGNNHITFYCNDLQSVPRSPPECAEFAAHKLRLLIRNISRLRIGRMYDGQ